MTTQPERTRPTVRALETHYAGYTFRSRTEARWAVFLSTLDVAWDYEPTGFEFNGERYLPDFWLPRQERWLEVKGVRPTPEEREKCQWLADGTGQPVLVVWGEPRPPDVLRDLPAAEADQALIFTADWDDYAYWWCVCPYCGYLDAEFEGRSARLRCRCVAIRHGDDHDRSCTWDHHPLPDAYAAARTAFTGPTFHGNRTPRYGSPAA